MSDDIYKSMPNSNDAERAVLGCILKDAEKLDEALDTISEKWFYAPAHQKVFAAMQKVAGGGKALDLLTLIEQLETEGSLDEVGGRSDVCSLLDEIPTVGFWTHYISILREKYQLREVIREATQIVATAYDAPEDAQALADSATEIMARVADCTARREDAPTMRVRAMDAIDRYQKAYERGTIQGLATGMKNFDSMTGGFLDSDLSIIAARPSFGKTAIMTQMAGHIGVTDKNEIGIFSGEMSGDSLTDRFFSQMSAVNLRELNGGKFTKRDFDRLMMQAKALATSTMIIDDRAGLTIGEIRRAGRRMKHKQGVKIIFLDYLQRFRADNQQEDNNERSRYAAISGGLKDMAKELKIPVVCLAQLGRSADGKKAVDMQMSDLEGCSKIEQDADLIGFLGLPLHDEEPPEMFRDVDFSIVKQRNGPTGNIPLRFRKSHTKFSEKTTI